MAGQKGRESKLLRLYISNKYDGGLGELASSEHGETKNRLQISMINEVSTAQAHPFS